MHNVEHSIVMVSPELHNRMTHEACIVVNSDRFELNIAHFTVPHVSDLFCYRVVRNDVVLKQHLNAVEAESGWHDLPEEGFFVFEMLLYCVL